MARVVLALADWRYSEQNPRIVGTLSVLLRALGFSVRYWWLSWPCSCVVLEAGLDDTNRLGQGPHLRKTFPNPCHSFCKVLVPQRSLPGTKIFLCILLLLLLNDFLSFYFWLWLNGSAQPSPPSSPCSSYPCFIFLTALLYLPNSFTLWNIISNRFNSFYVYDCLNVGLRTMCEQCPQRPGEGVRWPGIGDAGVCDLPVNSGNRTQVL